MIDFEQECRERMFCAISREIRRCDQLVMYEANGSQDEMQRAGRADAVHSGAYTIGRAYAGMPIWNIYDTPTELAARHKREYTEECYMSVMEIIADAIDRAPRSQQKRNPYNRYAAEKAAGKIKTRYSRTDAAPAPEILAGEIIEAFYS